METTNGLNEVTPLLGNCSTSNGHEQPPGIFATSNGQIPLDGNGSTNGHGVVSNSDAIRIDFSLPRNFDQEATEVTLEEIVEALRCTGWRRNRQPEDEIEFDFFNEKELYLMHLAWKKVERGRHCYAEAYRIVDAVAAAIAEEMNPRSEYDTVSFWELNFHTDKNLVAVNLLRNWERITGGYGFPPRYTRTIFEDEQSPAVSEFRLRLVELYDKTHDFIFNSTFQILMHSLLIIWPISILTIGTKYMECPMSYYASYLLLMLGVVGCLAVLVRLVLIHVTSHAYYPSRWFWEWVDLRFIESAFFIVFVIQACHFFNTDPEIEPDSHHCVENFYNAALGINYASIVLVSAYVFVYFTKICLRHFDVLDWIFRLL